MIDLFSIWNFIYRIVCLVIGARCCKTVCALCCELFLHLVSSLQLVAFWLLPSDCSLFGAGLHVFVGGRAAYGVWLSLDLAGVSGMFQKGLGIEVVSEIATNTISDGQGCECQADYA